jgi:DNA-binding XRE family transcriptional regulator
MTPAQLKQTRAKLKLSQAKLAAAIGISWRAMSDYERDVRPMPRVVALAIRAIELDPFA